eukprot:5146435-Prymnesium_polylepis.1
MRSSSLTACGTVGPTYEEGRGARRAEGGRWLRVAGRVGFLMCNVCNACSACNACNTCNACNVCNAYNVGQVGLHHLLPRAALAARGDGGGVGDDGRRVADHRHLLQQLHAAHPLPARLTRRNRGGVGVLVWSDAVAKIDCVQ